MVVATGVVDLWSVLPIGYELVLLNAVIMGVLIIVIGVMAGSLRGKEPWKSVKYPDPGTGIWANKLKEADWVTFNNYQRAHYNFLEGISTALTLLLIGGLFYPKLSALLGLVYNVGRFIYALGYQKYGSKGRAVGVALLDLALVALLIINLYVLVPRSLAILF